MNIKRFLIIAAAALVAADVFAATPARKSGGSRTQMSKAKAAALAEAEDEETAGMTDREKEKRNQIRIIDPPKTGKNNATAVAPSLQGPSFVNCNQKERRWILLETKYSNPVRQERLTFTWHVLLDMNKADKDVRKNWDDPALPNPPSRYSYFTTSVTYQNVPGSTTMSEHAASVCMPPSYLECFGEPVVVGLEIANKDGELMDGGFCVVSEIPSEIKDFHPVINKPQLQAEAVEKCSFWKNPDVMEKVYKKTNVKYVTMRQGLVDRSKTIWALVKPDYFEQVVQ